MSLVHNKLDGMGSTFNVLTKKAERHTGGQGTTGRNEYDRVYNIYDLEGNNIEMTAEQAWYNGVAYDVSRGNTANTTSNYGASSRYVRVEGGNTTTYRMVLYVMK